MKSVKVASSSITSPLISAFLGRNHPDGADARCWVSSWKRKREKKKDPQILLFSFRLRIGRNLWCGLWGGIKESESIPIFLQSDPCLTPTQPPLFLQHLYLFLLFFFFFFFFLSCLVFIRDQRCTSTDTLHACSHTWSTVLVPPSHLELRSKLELEKN